MQKQFFKWLFYVVIGTFLLTLFISFYMQTIQSQNMGKELLQYKINDVKQELDVNRKNLSTIKEIYDTNAITKAKSLAWIIKRNPNLLKRPYELNKFAQIIDVDEMHITDGNGIIIYSYPHLEYLCFDMKTTEQSREFIPALNDKNFVLVQDPMPKGADGKMFQYVGVSRIDKKGLVQVGYKTERLEEFKKLTDIKIISAGSRIGKNGTVLIIKDDKLIIEGIDNLVIEPKTIESIIKKSKKIKKSFKITIDNIKYTCLADNWENYTIVGILPESEMFLSRNDNIIVIIFVNLVIYFIIFILILLLLKQIVIKGIYNINKSLTKITQGDLNEKVQVRNVEEFQLLSDGINKTVNALKTSLAAETKRLDTELSLAKNIQVTTIPTIFPPYPEHTEFDIYATMKTAKSVGGDFYDFFFTDPNHLAILIADVSGKGIPAALFMMKTKTLIENLAKTGISPQRTMTKLNKQIYRNNEQEFFITVFFGIIELSTGKLTYVSAGHNPPLLRDSKGNIKYLNVKSNIVIGAIPDFDYESQTLMLDKGDMLLLYTDGITEAMNKNNKFYGTEKLQNFVDSLCQKETNLTNILNEINNDVDNFSEGMVQTDDMTMLLFRYNGFANLQEIKTSIITLEAHVDNYVKLVSWLENLCTQIEISNAYKIKLQIAVEELYVNIVKYAKLSPDDHIKISFQVNHDEVNGNEIEMKFIDKGMPYNPLTQPKEPDISLSVDERPIGGLGIFIVKQTMDSVDYQFVDNQNIFTIKMFYN